MELRKNGEPSRAMVRPVDMNIVRDEFLAVGTKELLLIRNRNVHCGCAVLLEMRATKKRYAVVYREAC